MSDVEVQEISVPTEFTVVKDKLLSPQFREYLYDVVLTLMPLLIIWGKLTHDTAQYILNVVAAILGLGTVGVSRLNKPQRTTVVPVKGGDSNGE